MSAVNDPHPDATGFPPDADPAVEAEDFFGEEPATGVAEGIAYPVEEPVPTAPLSEAFAPEETLAPPAEEPKKGGGQLEREYLIFQKTTLTEKVLRHLLAEAEAGDVKPRVAFFELDRNVSRNDRTAIGQAYASHKDVLGDRCELAAVSARAFKERRVAPEEVPPEKRIRIT